MKHSVEIIEKQTSSPLNVVSEPMRGVEKKAFDSKYKTTVTSARGKEKTTRFYGSQGNVRLRNELSFS